MRSCLLFCRDFSTVSILVSFVSVVTSPECSFLVKIEFTSPTMNWRKQNVNRQSIPSHQSATIHYSIFRYDSILIATWGRHRKPSSFIHGWSCAYSLVTNHHLGQSHLSRCDPSGCTVLMIDRTAMHRSHDQTQSLRLTQMPRPRLRLGRKMGAWGGTRSKSYKQQCRRILLQTSLLNCSTPSEVDFQEQSQIWCTSIRFVFLTRPPIKPTVKGENLQLVQGRSSLALCHPCGAMIPETQDRCWLSYAISTKYSKEEVTTGTLSACISIQKVDIISSLRNAYSLPLIRPQLRLMARLARRQS